MLPEAAVPRAAFSSPRSLFFTIRTDPKPANNMFFFPLQLLVLHQITNGFVYAPLSFNRVARRLLRPDKMFCFPSPDRPIFWKSKKKKDQNHL